jgi:hypothetical protein
MPDPTKATKEKGEKFVALPGTGTFFCSHVPYHKSQNHYDFELVKKKIWAILQRIVVLFYPKNCH